MIHRDCYNNLKKKFAARLGGEKRIMTKADLVEIVAKKASLTAKAARESVAAVFGAMTDALKKGDKVVVTGFGTFMIRSRKARTGRNPQTGKPISIPARKTPGFTAGKALKKAVR